MDLLPQLAVGGLFGFVCLLVPVYCVRILLLTAWRRLAGRDLLRRRRLDRPVVRLLILSLGLIELCCFLYAWTVEPYRLEVTQETLRSDRLAAGATLRIVQISDLHIEADGQPVSGSGMATGSAPGGSGEGKPGLADLVAAQAPDLVVLTGDYLNTDSPEAEAALRRLLGSLQPPYGTYAILGNWDYRSWSRAGAILRESGVHVLAASSEEVDVRGTGVLLMNGQVPPEHPAHPPSDGQAGNEPGGRPIRIYLAHSPDSIEDVAGRVDLYFCGHTHGGQIRLPWFGAIVTLSRFWKRYEMGRYEVNGTTAFVNRGIGCEGGPVPRVRFLSPPEILVVDVANSVP